MKKSEIITLLNKLNSNDLKLLLKKKGARGYSGLKKKDLVQRVLSSYDDLEKLFQEATELYETKVIERIKDGIDHFLNNRIEILYADEDIIKADVNGHSVIIYGLKSGNPEYRCDDSCQDYIYNVKSKKVPFCKHFIAAVTEAIYSGNISISDIPLLNSERYRALIESAIDRKRRLEGIDYKNREIEATLELAEQYYIEISHQNESVARKVFKDSAEKIFESFTLKLFELLEFETISNRSPHGWDGIVIGIHSTPPFIGIIECKTAQSGVYDYIVKHPEYLVNLKVYAIDLVKNKLFGAFRNYVKYVMVVAPSFPREAETLRYNFQNMTGLQLSFIPASVLLYFVKKYRENPIVTHSWMEDLFREGGIWTNERIDLLFNKSEKMIEMLSLKVTEKILEWMRQYISLRSDAAFINLDVPMFEELASEFFKALSPELAVMGKREVTGVETIRLRHDYFAIWEKVLKNVGKAFIDYLKELSETQERTTEMKAEIIRQLRLIK